MSCPNCGATLDPQELVQPACRYCGKALAAYAQAQAKVMQVQALMGDANGNGIPDALEGFVAPYAGMMRPMPPMAPMPPYAMPPGTYAVPPAGAPVADPMAGAAAAQLGRTFVKGIVLATVVPAVIGVVVTIVALIAAFAVH
jgi:hypothetical protein